MKNVKECIYVSSRRKKANRGLDTSFSAKQTNMKVATTIGLMVVVLSYIPKSQGKHGQLSFSECSVPKSTTKTDSRYDRVD